MHNTTKERRTPTSFTLPLKTRQLITERARIHRRSQSSYVEELVRTEAGEPTVLSLRLMPTYTPTAAEKRAMAKGRASKSMTLEDFFAHVERLATKSRR